MNELSNRDSTAVPERENERNRRSFWQFGIVTILLLMAVIGTWFAFYRSRVDGIRYAAELPKLRLLARELIIDDPSKYAVARQKDYWRAQIEGHPMLASSTPWHEKRWLVHLPEGHDFRLMGEFAIFEGSELKVKKLDLEIEPGKHEISIFEQSRTEGKDEFVICVDGETVFRATCENVSSYSTGSGGSGDDGQFDLDSMLELQQVYWHAVRAPANLKKSFDARDKNETYYKTRLYIRTR